MAGKRGEPKASADDARRLLQRMESLGLSGVSDLPKQRPRKPVEGRVVSQAATRAPSPSSALEVLREEVAGCRRCGHLAESRTQTVFGSGRIDARLCFMGEAPGADEDASGMPFVGRAGQLLTKIIEACTLSRDDVYILNVLKCRPPENRAPLPQETANCRGFFERQLEIIAPEFICCLGPPGNGRGDRSAAETLVFLAVRPRDLHLPPVLSAAKPGGEAGGVGRHEAADGADGARAPHVRRLIPRASAGAVGTGCSDCTGFSWRRGGRSADLSPGVFGGGAAVESDGLAEVKAGRPEAFGGRRIERRVPRQRDDNA